MEFPESRIHLEAWLTIVKHAKWKTYLDVRQSFPGTDPVKLASGDHLAPVRRGNAAGWFCRSPFGEPRLTSMMMFRGPQKVSKASRFARFLKKQSETLRLRASSNPHASKSSCSPQTNFSN